MSGEKIDTLREWFAERSPDFKSGPYRWEPSIYRDEFGGIWCPYDYSDGTKIIRTSSHVFACPQEIGEYLCEVLNDT